MRWDRFARTTRCTDPVRPTEAAAAYQRRDRRTATGSTWSTSGWGPTATAPRSSPDRRPWPSTDPSVWWRPTATQRRQSPRPDHAHPAGHRPGPLVVFTVRERRSDRPWQVVAGEDLPAARVTADEVLWLIDADAAGDTELPARWVEFEAVPVRCRRCPPTPAPPL